MSSLKAKSLKRIVKDLTENAENPIDGIKIYIPDNEEDLFNLHCEIKILNGIYKNIIIHTIIHIPEEYPIVGPAMNIADDFNLPHQFHEHVLGKSICNDMLTNFSSWFKQKDGPAKAPKASGWSPGYSLNVIMSQMQIFFAEPDLPDKLHLKSHEIDTLIKYSQNYKCNGCSKKLEFKKENEMATTTNVATVPFIDTDSFRKRLICGLSKMSYFDDNLMILGYPLLMNIDKFGRLWPQVLLELLSYESYMQQIQQEGGIIKLDNFNSIKFYSPNGNLYNYWIPIYINEEHFKRGYQIIINSMAVIRFGIVNGNSKYDFKPDILLEVLPCLINKTIVSILNGTMYHSIAAIQAYCHFLRLYYKFIQFYPQIKQKINEIVKNFLHSKDNRNKSKCRDLGEFIINLFLSDYSYNDLKEALIGEFFARQIFWIEKTLMCRLENIPTNRLLEKTFEASKVGKHLLVFNIKAAKWFIDENKMKHLDACYGFIPENIVTKFKEVIENIKKINNDNEFIHEIEFESTINSNSKMIEFIMNAKQDAIKSGYIK